MIPSQKAIEEFKEIWKKQFGKELSDAEASESAYNLLNYFETLYKCAEADFEKEQRLKKEPRGFHLTDGTYNCAICHRDITGDNSWYDKWGPKCLLCQKAVENGAVPSFVCKDRDSWYPMWQMKSKFGLAHQTVKKLIRQDKLKPRIVTNNNGVPYEYIFLKKENPDLVDPDRHTPARKSYDRHRNKVTELAIREERKKRRAEFAKLKARLNKKLKAR